MIGTLALNSRIGEFDFRCHEQVIGKKSFKKSGLLFGRFEDVKISFWNYLTFKELQISDELPAIIFQDDIEFTEIFEVDDTNEQNMMVPENNAIECEWQIVENEKVVVNNLEGIEIVVDLQPKDSNGVECLWNWFPCEKSIISSFDKITSNWNLLKLLMWADHGIVSRISQVFLNY